MVEWPASATVHGCVSFRNNFCFFVLKPRFLYIRVAATSILSWFCFACCSFAVFVAGSLSVSLAGLALALWTELALTPQRSHFCLARVRVKGLLHRACWMYPFPFFHFLSFVSLNLKHVSHGLYVVGSCGCCCVVFWVFSHCVYLCLSIPASPGMQMGWVHTVIYFSRLTVCSLYPENCWLQGALSHRCWPGFVRLPEH